MTNSWVYEVQKEGAKGAQVAQIQRSLPTWASPELLVADGIFGSKTKSAIINFQSYNNLPQDGAVGKVTGQALKIWADVEKGFDISHWNTIIWDQVPSDIRFVNVKATEGKTYVDPKFQESVIFAELEGLQTNAYHFTKFANPPHQEAFHFLSTIYGYNIKEAFLDLEYRESGLTSTEVHTWIDGFMSVISKFFKGKCGIYTSSNYLREIGLQADTSLSQYKLWGASWGDQPRVVPWETWNYWQYTALGEVPWATEEICLDYRVVQTSK